MVVERRNFDTDKNDRPDVTIANAGSKAGEELVVDGLYTHSREPRTQEEWCKWLRLTKAVEEDLERKAQLMAAFQRGVDYVEKEAAKRGIGYKRPAIGIVTTQRDDSFSPPRVGAILGELIFVATWHLEEASQYNYEEPMSFWGSDEEPVYAGATVPDYFMLSGVEEAHHALFYQREGNWTLPPLHPKTTPSALYDAQDHEYEALQWQIEAARALGFPEETVETLQHCLQAATTVREEQASKEHAAESRSPTSEDVEGTAQHTTGKNTEHQEKTVDPQANVLEDTPESTETWTDLPSSAQGLEEHRQDEDQQESDDGLRFKGSRPAGSEIVGGPNLDTSNGGIRYQAQTHVEHDEMNSSPAPDAARDEYRDKHNEGGYDRN